LKQLDGINNKNSVSQIFKIKEKRSYKFAFFSSEIHAKSFFRSQKTAN